MNPPRGKLGEKKKSNPMMVSVFPRTQRPGCLCVQQISRTARLLLLTAHPSEASPLPSLFLPSPAAACQAAFSALWLHHFKVPLLLFTKTNRLAAPANMKNSEKQTCVLQEWTVIPGKPCKFGPHASSFLRHSHIWRSNWTAEFNAVQLIWTTSIGQ